MRIRKLFCSLLPVLLLAAMSLAGCGAPEEPQEVVEQYGFRFGIPQAATSWEVADGTYDINFGEGADKEGVICFYAPQTWEGATNALHEDAEQQKKLQALSASYFDQFEGMQNTVSENRKLAGQNAYYCATDAIIYGIKVRYEVYVMYGDGVMHNITAMRYTDDITKATGAAMDDFFKNLEYAE